MSLILFNTLSLRRQSVNTLLKWKYLKRYSTQPIPKIEQNKNDQHEKQLKKYEKIARIQQKTKVKKPQKPPFAKNLLLGIFDEDILTYPEVLDKEDLQHLNKHVSEVEQYFRNEKSLIPPEKRIRKEHLEKLNTLNALGVQCSQLLGGNEYNLTETCRLFEVMSENSGEIGILNSNQFGIQILMKYGSTEQKNKYLRQLISGKSVAAFCLSEKDSANLKELSTKATLAKDKKSWVLNGEKVYVVNGESADIFIVYAQSILLNQFELEETEVKVFIVERGHGGVVTESSEAIGLDGTDISTVSFNNTNVPVENILGELNKGEDFLKDLLLEARITSGIACVTLAKQATNKFMNYCKSLDGGNESIAYAEAIQKKVAWLNTSVYAMESVTYLTCSLLDQYEKQDCEVETAITKIFNSSRCFESTMLCTEFIGVPAYMKGHWCNQFRNDALSHVLFTETNENLKLAVAMLGLQHAGIALNDKIRMNRNPLYYPNYIFKKIWTDRKQLNDNPKLNLKLFENLHPSLIVAANFLEYSILRLKYATEVLLSRHGSSIIDKHIDLERLARCVIDIYVATAVLGRASRSYCIGLQYAECEVTMANCFVSEVRERVRTNVKKIVRGPYYTNDESGRKISKRAFKVGKYIAEHPLTRNY